MNLSIIEQFSQFRSELDSKHDRWERIVKISRDITVESKRTIFLLHRIDILCEEHESRLKILSESESKLSTLSKKWQQIATEFGNDDPRLYLRAYSPGLQEYIEAIAFLHYLYSESTATIESIHTCVVTIDDIKEKISFSQEGAHMKIPVPVTEFLLGIADTTGEIMRMCINAASKASSKASIKQVFKLCAFIRLLYEMFSTFSSIVDDSSSRRNVLQGKLDTMKSSMQKVEECCYQLGIRDSELLDTSLSKSLKHTATDSK